MSKRNKTLDLGRLIAALLVIVIHAPLPGLVGQLAESATRVAVPFFFMVSGYYCWEKNLEQIKKKACRTAILLLWSVALYIAWSMVMSIYYGGTLHRLQTFFSPKTLFETFVLNNGVLLGHLWFLLALIYCYLIYAFVMRQAKFGTKVAVSVGLIVAFFVVREVLRANGVADPVYYLRNFLFVGMPFFLLGELVAQKRNWLLGGSALWWLPAALIGFAAAAAERLTMGICDLYVGSVLASVALFVLAQRDGLGVNDRLARWGSNYAGDIYVFHLIVVTVLNIVGSIFGVLQNSAYLFTRPVVVLVVCIAIAMMKERFLAVVVGKRKGAKADHEKTAEKTPSVGDI